MTMSLNQRVNIQPTTYDIYPFLESRHEVSSRYSGSGLAAAATEYIIATAAYFPAASYMYHLNIYALT